MSVVVGIDPGARHCGWCILFPGSLEWTLSCGLSADRPRAASHAEEVVQELRGRDVAALVVERPQVYVGRKQVGDPNDLIQLAFVGGTFAALVPHRHLFTPRPAQWKGQVPKDIHHARLAKRMGSTWPAIEASARRWGKLAHNVYDAVGLALYGLDQIRS
jgi:hypothetical protein